MRRVRCITWGGGIRLIDNAGWHGLGKNMSKKIEFAETDEIDKRDREVQIILNVVEPDPEYQPLFVSDEATFFDISGQDEKEIESRLRFYFKGELPALLSTPLWQFIEIIKTRYPGWPDDWPPEH